MKQRKTYKDYRPHEVYDFLNGNDNCYIIFFGRNPKNIPNIYFDDAITFKYIKEARKYAAPYWDAHIYKVHYRWNEDIPEMREISIKLRKKVK